MRSFICAIIMAGLICTPTFAIGGNRQLPEPSFQFNVIPTAGPEKVKFELVLTNNGEIPLNFLFPTSQLFEISVKGSQGGEVYRYSKGRMFLQAFQTVSIQPQKTFHRVVEWNYLVNGKRVPSGEYIVTATFLPTKLNDEPIKSRENFKVSKKMFIPDENLTFHHVSVKGKKGNYLISGKVPSTEGPFFYTVEDGHNEYTKEQQLNVTNEQSFTIEIHIPEEKLPENGSLLLYLFEKNKDQQMINSYPIILEKF